MRTLTSMRIVLGLGVLLSAAGCGGGSNASNGSTTPTAPPAIPSQGPGALQELNPSTGALGSATLDPIYADVPARILVSPEILLFRRVEAGSSLQGSVPGSLGAQPGEGQQLQTVATFELGTTEVTQAQWTALATVAGRSGSDLAPWLQITPATSIGAITTGPTLPAYGLSVDLIAAVLTGFNAYQGTGRPHLRLPTAVEWEHACRAGSSARYAWGEDESQATASRYAVVRETRPGDGVSPVAGVGSLPRLPNALGFYDMEGNVWEPVSNTLGPDAVLRGALPRGSNVRLAAVEGALRIEVPAGA